MKSKREFETGHRNGQIIWYRRSGTRWGVRRYMMKWNGTILSFYSIQFAVTLYYEYFPLGIKFVHEIELIAKNKHVINRHNCVFHITKKKTYVKISRLFFHWINSIIKHEQTSERNQKKQSRNLISFIIFFFLYFDVFSSLFASIFVSSSCFFFYLPIINTE